MEMKAIQNFQNRKTHSRGHQPNVQMFSNKIICETSFHRFLSKMSMSYSKKRLVRCLVGLPLPLPSRTT